MKVIAVWHRTKTPEKTVSRDVERTLEIILNTHSELKARPVIAIESPELNIPSSHPLISEIRKGDSYRFFKALKLRLERLKYQVKQVDANHARRMNAATTILKNELTLTGKILTRQNKQEILEEIAKRMPGAWKHFDVEKALITFTNAVVKHYGSVDAKKMDEIDHGVYFARSLKMKEKADEEKAEILVTGYVHGFHLKQIAKIKPILEKEVDAIHEAYSYEDKAKYAKHEEFITKTLEEFKLQKPSAKPEYPPKFVYEAYQTLFKQRKNQLHEKFEQIARNSY